MTLRSVLLGLAGAAVICGVTFLNDRVLKGTYLIGNNMPVAVYGSLILFVVAVNPLLRRLALTGREIAVALTLTVAACCIPSSGLLRTFTGVLVLPRHFEKTQPGWAGDPAALADADVRDWRDFLSALKGTRAAGAPQRRLWQRLPEGLRTRLAGTEEEPPPGLRVAVREALNALVRDRSWPDSGDLEALDLPDGARQLASADPAELTDREVEILGRAALDAVFPDHIVSRRAGVLEGVPSHMLVDAGDDEETVVGGFVQGLGLGTQHASVGQVPWSAWWRPLLFWVPLVLVLLTSIICLSVVVHRQWSQHELLPYPIALFTDALLPDEGTGGAARASVMRSRLFWIGAGCVLFIHLTNYAFQWSPRYLIYLPTRFNFGSLAPLFPTLVRGGGGYVFYPRVYFIVIGIAYLVANDVSLSFAVGPFLWALVVGTFAGYGIWLNAPVEGTGWWMSMSPRLFVIIGACLGVFLTLAYTGRRHYGSVARGALGLKTTDEVSPAETWAFRGFVCLATAFVCMMSFGANVPFVYALLYTAIAFIGFVVTSRVMAETGLFHMQIMVFPCIILWGLFGARMIGVKTLLVMQIVSVVLFVDLRESLMPYMVNALKLLERRGVSLGRPAALAVLAIVVGLAVGLPTTLYIQYDRGLTHDHWAEQRVPKMPFENAVALTYKHEAQGIAGSTTDDSTTDRARGFSPHMICVYSLLAGLVLVFLFTVARLRLTWWPLHPLMFALWATGHIRAFASSFLIGWTVKVLVVKYGGNAVYDRLKPLMVGLIAGEVLGAFMPCLVGVLYWMATGEPPRAFRVLPG